MNLLDRPISDDEIKEALFSVGPLKAPGLDGLHALFYQNRWPIVGRSLPVMVRDVFDGGELSHEINSIGIVLISKVDSPETLSQFRPISLCNVRYQVITKVVANRLKSIMPQLIGPLQSSFVLGCHIINNIIISQETIHSMNRKKR